MAYTSGVTVAGMAGSVSVDNESMCTALGIGERDDLALTRHNLLHVGDGLLEHSVMGRR